MSAHQWSTTALANQTADARAQFQEGQAASSLNNGCRGMMASAALWRDDHLGTLVATVSSTNVFTVNTNEGLIDPASIAGGGTAKITKPFLIRVVLPAMPAAVATSAPTIVIDGAAAVPLVRRDGTALVDGDLAGVAFEILGDTITSGAISRARILDLLKSDIAALIPSVAAPITILVGTLIDWPSAVTPDGYIEPVGALLSRTDYAPLWAFAQASGMLVADSAWSTNPGKFSTGDGSTNFRTMDVRGDFIRALDSGRGVDSGRALGSFQASQNLAHFHGAANNYRFFTEGPDYPVQLTGGSGTESLSYYTSTSGGNEARPRNTAYRKLLKYK